MTCSLLPDIARAGLQISSAILKLVCIVHTWQSSCPWTFLWGALSWTQKRVLDKWFSHIILIGSEVISANRPHSVSQGTCSQQAHNLLVPQEFVETASSVRHAKSPGRPCVSRATGKQLRGSFVPSTRKRLGKLAVTLSHTYPRYNSVFFSALWQLKRSKSRYDWRSVGQSVCQYVKEPSPLWDLWPDITFCPKVVVWKLLSCLCRAPCLSFVSLTV
jgi:hypothetical protein